MRGPSHWFVAATMVAMAVAARGHTPSLQGGGATLAAKAVSAIERELLEKERAVERRRVPLPLGSSVDAHRLMAEYQKLTKAVREAVPK